MGEILCVGPSGVACSARVEMENHVNSQLLAEAGVQSWYDNGWQFFADGPVRLAPAAWRGKVYFGADDGYFYCLDADSGKLLWKLLAAPSDRRAIGSERLISVWPVRGGPVIVEHQLYFTAGVWPFEDTLLYSVDLAGGSKPKRNRRQAHRRPASGSSLHWTVRLVGTGLLSDRG